MHQPTAVLFFVLGYTLSNILLREGQFTTLLVGLATATGVLIGLLSSLKTPSRDGRWQISFLRVAFGILKGGSFALAAALLVSFADLEYTALVAGLGAVAAYFQPSLKYNAGVGLNPVSGCKPSEKLSVAKQMLHRATFWSDGYSGLRTMQHFSFDENGARASYLAMLKNDLAEASDLTFGVLAILVKQLPDQPEEPTLLVIRDAKQLRLLSADADGIYCASYNIKVNAKDILATTTYAWLQPRNSD